MKRVMINGRIVDAAQAVVPVMDHGFLYGMGLFETFRTYGGQPFMLVRHMQRLAEGCRLLGIPFEIGMEQLKVWISELMADHGLQEAYIRYTVSAGEDILGLPTENYKHPNHVLMVKELPKVADELYKNGKPLQLLQARRNTPESPVRLKSLHYMNNILAKRELASHPAAIQNQAEGLMLSEQGYICEGIVSNIFFVHNRCLYTPHTETGLLPGITRGLVLELARNERISAEEGFYGWETLLTADEIFITNSIQELVPITSLLNLDGTRHLIGNGQAGPITSKLLQWYRQKAGNQA